MIWIILMIIVGMSIYTMIERLKSLPLTEATQAISTFMKEQQQLEKQKAETIKHHNDLIDKIKNIDANFSYSSFQTLVKNTSKWAMEVKSTNHQEAMEKLRKVASASFLNDYVHDLVKLSQASECAYRNVNVEELYMKDVRQEQNYDVIEVEVMVCYDYSTYQNKKLLRQKEMKSKLHLIYSKHKEKIGINQEYEAMTHCKNCGAPVDVIHDEKCPYCDSYYYTKSNIWMLHELREYQQELYGLS